MVPFVKRCPGVDRTAVQLQVVRRRLIPPTGCISQISDKCGLLRDKHKTVNGQTSESPGGFSGFKSAG